MPPPQEERWQQQLSRVNEQLQERDSDLRKATIDCTLAETELSRVKQQLSEATTQLIQAQQQAPSQAQIEQQVSCDARSLLLCRHAPLTPDAQVKERVKQHLAVIKSQFQSQFLSTFDFTDSRADVAVGHQLTSSEVTASTAVVAEAGSLAAPKVCSIRRDPPPATPAAVPAATLPRAAAPAAAAIAPQAAGSLRLSCVL